MKKSILVLSLLALSLPMSVFAVDARCTHDDPNAEGYKYTIEVKGDRMSIRQSSERAKFVILNYALSPIPVRTIREFPAFSCTKTVAATSTNITIRVYQNQVQVLTTSTVGRHRPFAFRMTQLGPQ